MRNISTVRMRIQPQQLPHATIFIHMKSILRFFRSILIALTVALVAWVAVTQIFDRLDERVPTFIAIIATYFISAYLFFPRAVHVGTVLFRNKKIPHYTRTPDGLTADPVNIILFGTKQQLMKAFASIGWNQAERLSIGTAWRMAKAFLSNRPYSTAPFSPLYLFGRMQDVGFEEAISNSPRQRHHIRFWAANTKPQNPQELLANLNDIKYWTSKQEVSETEPLMWVGAGTKDTGFGLTKLTFQISHRVDRRVDAEREYIVGKLADANAVSDIQRLESGMSVNGHYVSDGRIATAKIGS